MTVFPIDLGATNVAPAYPGKQLDDAGPDVLAPQVPCATPYGPLLDPGGWDALSPFDPVGPPTQVLVDVD